MTARQDFAFMRSTDTFIKFQSRQPDAARLAWLACLSSRKYVEQRRRGMGDGRRFVCRAESQVAQGKWMWMRRQNGCAVVLCCTAGRNASVGGQNVLEADRHGGVRGAPGTRHLFPTAQNVAPRHLPSTEAELFTVESLIQFNVYTNEPFLALLPASSTNLPSFCSTSQHLTKSYLLPRLLHPELLIHTAGPHLHPRWREPVVRFSGASSTAACVALPAASVRQTACHVDSRNPLATQL